MNDTLDLLSDEESPRARLVLLLKHFSRLDDEREPWRVMYPLSEVLLLVTCATIASCDDFDAIALWGEHHLEVDLPNEERAAVMARSASSSSSIPSMNDRIRRRTPASNGSNQSPPSHGTSCAIAIVFVMA